MRDRLVDLILECRTYTPEYEPQARLHAEYLANHLLNNGVIVPPVKVGDTVYVVDDDLTHGIAEGVISNLEYNQYTTPKEWITVESNGSIFGWYEKKHRIDRVLGKTVFLTRAEAEKAVAQMNKEGER